MNKEIDEICCRFAGLEPLWFILYPKSPSTGPSTRRKGPFKKPDAERVAATPSRYGIPSGIEPEYPPVSTSWEAAGWLSAVLRKKGIRYEVIAEMDHVYVHVIPAAEAEKYYMKASDFPMALALAVAELAKQQQQ